MTHKAYGTRQRGFNLIEILVAVAVMAVGLAALAKFHGAMIKAGSEAKSRSVAMSLAVEKAEDLRGYQALTGTGSPKFGWDEIADNQGGDIASGDKTVSNVVYSLTWDVTQEVTLGGGSQDKYKDVSINVAWTDQLGADQEVELDVRIAAAEPAGAARAVADPLDHENPIVTHTPGQVPDVVAVPIEVGGGIRKETSKPEPEVISSGQTDTLVVTFDVVTYDSNNNNQALQQESFATVNCTCQLNANDSTSYGWTAARRVWTGSDLIDQTGEWVNKPSGRSVLGNAGVDKELCDICCRDHHDAPSSGNSYGCDPSDDDDADSKRWNCYDRQRPYTGPNADYGAFGNNNHNHYAVDDLDNPVASADAEYIEVCRMKRIDGVWRVFSDWNLVEVVNFPYDYLTSVGDNLLSYLSLVRTVAKAEVVVGTTIPALTGTGMSLVPGTSKQALARSVYVDEMSTEHKSYLQTEIAADANGAWLGKVPFYEINTTLLNTWSAASMGDSATVTNEDIDTIVDPVNNYYGTYSRGLVVGAAEGTADVSVATRISNSGQTGSPEADADYGATDPDDRDMVDGHSFEVTVVGEENILGISGIISNVTNVNGLNSLDVYMYVIDGTGSCGPDPDNLGQPLNYVNSGKYFSFSCEVEAGSTVAIQAEGANLDFYPEFYEFPDISVQQTGCDFALCGTGDNNVLCVAPSVDCPVTP